MEEKSTIKNPEENNQNSVKQQQPPEQPQKQPRFLNWKKFLYDENLAIEILKFEQWDKQNLKFEEATVLKKDLTRTRARDPFFQKEKTQLKLQQIATFYCQQHFVNYQQGMLELVIPFLLLQNKDFKLSKCYGYFVSFMNLYFPKFLIQKPLNDTKELPYLTSALHFCEVLLKFHNPRLAYLLREADIDLSMGITQLIITLFAKETDIPLVYTIFDQFMKRKNPLFIFYMVVQIVINQQEKIEELVQEDPDLLIMFFNKDLKKLQTEDQIMDLFQSAEQLQNQTPNSFEIYLQNQGFTQKQVLSQNQIQQLINKDIVIHYIPLFISEFQDFIRNNNKNKQIPHFISIDMTQKDQKIDNKQKGQPKFSIKQPQKLHDYIINKVDPDSHICLIMNTLKSKEDKQVLKQFLDGLQQTGKKYVSVLIGGYQSILNQQQHTVKK